MLKEGNKRFTSGNMVNRDLMLQVRQTAKDQYPYAVVLGCIDSREVSELIFDQGIGDMFDTRVAGNYADEEILGGLEFSCKVMGAKLIVVLGHTNCGAIKGACDNVELGNLTALLNKIKPAVDVTKSEGERNSKNQKFVEHVSENNVLLTIQYIKDKSPVLKEMLDKGEIGIIGGMYNLETGVVKFYE